MKYITNVRCVVRVDGVVEIVEPSTYLPEGVTDEEIARLLRFDVIRVADPEPEEVAAEVVAASQATTKRSRKKATTVAVEPEPEAVAEAPVEVEADVAPEASE